MFYFILFYQELHSLVTLVASDFSVRWKLIKNLSFLATVQNNNNKKKQLNLIFSVSRNTHCTMPSWAYTFQNSVRTTQCLHGHTLFRIRWNMVFFYFICYTARSYVHPNSKLLLMWQIPWSQVMCKIFKTQYTVFVCGWCSLFRVIRRWLSEEAEKMVDPRGPHHKKK